MAETFTFDPTDEGTGTQLQIVPSTSTAYALVGHEYPTPAVDPVWAGSVDTEGDRRVSQRFRNREIKMTWEVFGTTAANTRTALSALQSKIAKLQREGGTFRRMFETGETITFDVLTVSNYDATHTDHEYYLGNVVTVSFTLVCEPFGRGAEETLADHSETTLGYLKFVETLVKGDVPAQAQVIVDNDEAVDDAYMMLWGERSRRYDSASSAALAFEAESCTDLGGGSTSVVADATASSGNVLRHSSLLVTYTDILAVDNGTSATHVGTYRVFARVKCPFSNTGDVNVRLSWWANYGSVNRPPVINAACAVPDTASWFLADLGIITIPVAEHGTQRWYGTLSAKATTGSDDIDVDYILLIPADEGSGEARGEEAGTDPFMLVEPSLSLLLNHRTCKIEGASNTWGDPKYAGDYFFLQPSGSELRATELVFKFTQGIFGDVFAGLADDSKQFDTSAQIVYTPRYLDIPDE